MPRRVIQALALLTLLIIAASPSAAVAVTVSTARIDSPPRFQEEFQEEAVADEVIAEDEFSSFTMPGLAPDNLTATVLADIDAFWAGELANLGHDYY